MKIATFNANSIRVREGIVMDWLAENEPDVLAIQEIKCETDIFPAESFAEIGYSALVDGQKSYNGVAILHRGIAEEVTYGFGDPTMPDDKRIIRATIDGVRVINTYVPNGNKVGSEKFEYKLQWLDRFKLLIDQEQKRYNDLIWLGDINIAPQADDVFEPEKKGETVGRHPDEISRLLSITDSCLIDCFRKFTQGSGHYTFWEFMIPNGFKRNLGWRIDHIYATTNLAEKCGSCVVDREPRGLERPSDHTFVVAEFS